MPVAGIALSSRHLVRRWTDVGDPGRKAGLIGCLRLKHVANDGGDRPRGAARGRAREGTSRREELEDDHDQEH